MSYPTGNATELVTNSLLYKEFLAERAEILRHKWIESEMAGYDIGFEHALDDGSAKHRFRLARTKKNGATPRLRLGLFHINPARTQH